MGFINDLADALEDMNNKYDKKKQDELEKEMNAKLYKLFLKFQ